MNKFPYLAAGALALASSACAALLGIHQVPLKHSSVDFHAGTPHTTQVQGADANTVIRDLTSLAEKRGLTLASNECTPERCEVVYNGESNSQSKTYGSSTTSGGGTQSGGTTRPVSTTSNVNTVNMNISARYFARVEHEGSGFRVEMIGVPLINTKPSCPDVLASRGRCTAEMFNVQGDKTPAQSFQGTWGVDISGQSEADVISGVFAELALAQNATGSAATQVAGSSGAEAPSAAATSTPAAEPTGAATAAGSVPAQ